MKIMGWRKEKPRSAEDEALYQKWLQARKAIVRPPDKVTARDIDYLQKLGATIPISGGMGRGRARSSRRR